MSGPPVVWLASYPRSGNTWVRFLLANLMDTPVTNSAAMAQRVPDLHRGWPTLDPAQPFACIKTHYRPDRLSTAPMLTGRPLTQGGAILLVRHPVPVMASNLRYFLARVVLAPDGPTRAEQTAAFISHWTAEGGFRPWTEQGFGTWADHVATWRQQAAHLPVMMLRYEDLQADPEREVTRLAHFLGLPDSRVAAAIAHSDFETLQRLEDQERQAGVPGILGQRAGRFVDCAGAGATERFAPETLRALWQHVGPTAEALGYHCPV